MSEYLIPFPKSSPGDSIEIVAVFHSQGAKFAQGDILFVAETPSGERLEATALTDGAVLDAPIKGPVRKSEVIGRLDVARPTVEPEPSELAKHVGLPGSLDATTVTIDDFLLPLYQRFEADAAVVEVRTPDGGKHFVGAPEPGWVVRTTPRGQSVTRGEVLFVFEPAYRTRKLGYTKGKFPIQIHRLEAKDGQPVQSGDPICVIQDYSGKKARMRAPESGVIQTLGFSEGDIIQSPQALFHLLVERPIEHPVTDESPAISWTLKPLEKAPPRSVETAAPTAAQNPQQLLPEAGLMTFHPSAPSLSEAANNLARDGGSASQPPRKTRETSQDSSGSGNWFLFFFLAFILGGGVMIAAFMTFDWDWPGSRDPEQSGGAKALVNDEQFEGSVEDFGSWRVGRSTVVVDGVRRLNRCYLSSPSSDGPTFGNEFKILFDPLHDGSGKGSVTFNLLLKPENHPELRGKDIGVTIKGTKIPGHTPDGLRIDLKPTHEADEGQTYLYYGYEAGLSTTELNAFWQEVQSRMYIRALYGDYLPAAEWLGSWVGSGVNEAWKGFVTCIRDHS